ncbi:hypothetical protein [Hespellia stercorisuis]|uniref:Uncharacterized protein n=1 Tax=Hespellia stercorisuis DSM 15480 TaxID=1121950 RepID=A0A1M6RMM9_9FIRM|nr:hypothetical protein [Hespellia stercorisuis]SHK33712.1 hypothetical protein SAMN02745243_02736 [Hespellia stercorisuis DSM 15480]
MRLKQNRLHKYVHMSAGIKRDNEGGTCTEYGEPSCFSAEMWSAGGKVQTEQYGDRVPNIRNLRIDGRYSEISGENGKLMYSVEKGPTITVNDGICINSDQPDYKVIAIYPYSHLTIEVEKI